MEYINETLVAESVQATSYIQKDLEDGSIYYFTICSYNALGYSQ